MWCLPSVWFLQCLLHYWLVFEVLFALLIDFWSAYRTTDWFLQCLLHYRLIFLTKDVTTVFHTYETGLRTGTIHPKVRNADENIHLTNRKCYSKYELKNPWKNELENQRKIFPIDPNSMRAILELYILLQIDNLVFQPYIQIEYWYLNKVSPFRWQVIESRTMCKIW